MSKRHEAVNPATVLARLEELQKGLARLVVDFRKEVAREMQERNKASATRLAEEWVKEEKQEKRNPFGEWEERYDHETDSMKLVPKEGQGL